MRESFLRMKFMDTHTTTTPGDRPNQCKIWGVCEKLLDLFPFDETCDLFSIAPPKAEWQVGARLEKLGTDLIRAEKPFRTEVEATIRALCAGQSVPTSPEITYFLQLRSHVVFWFFTKLELSNFGDVFQTMAPFPNGLSESEVIQCLMIDWFNANGPQIAALLRLEENHAGLEDLAAREW
jgi:hypothetical protein